jgi:hypothetical protein
MERRIKRVITKRKAKDLVLKGITFAACLMAVGAPLMHAFEKPRLIYAVMFLASIAWCFAYSNGGARCER